MNALGTAIGVVVQPFFPGTIQFTLHAETQHQQRKHTTTKREALGIAEVSPLFACEQVSFSCGPPSVEVCCQYPNTIRKIEQVVDVISGVLPLILYEALYQVEYLAHAGCVWRISDLEPSCCYLDAYMSWIIFITHVAGI